MIFRLGCLFVLIPLLELVILIRIGQGVGLLPTVALVAGTGFVGAFLARREGLRVIRAIQGELAAGKLPTRSLLHAAAVLVGGALLLTPGIVTDLAGLGLLLPPTRRLFSSWVRSRMARALEHGTLRVAVWEPGGRRPGADPGPPDSATGPRRGEIIQE